MTEPDPIPPGNAGPQNTQNSPAHRGRNPRRGNNSRNLPKQHTDAQAQQSSNVDDLSQPATQPSQRGRGRGRGRGRENGPRGPGDQHAGSAAQNEQNSDSQGPRSKSRPGGRGPRRQPRKDNPIAEESPAVSDAGSDSKPPQRAPQHSRRRQFGAKLTSTDADGAEGASKPVSHVKEAKDLTSRLEAAFARGATEEETPECPICFNTISPGAPIWSCTLNSVSNPDPVHEEHGSGSCCWTPFHLKCIKSWASKTAQATKEAYEARGLHDRSGEWRCPGCQTRRTVVPSEYRCFCGRSIDPRPGRLATPHSCGEGCSRLRPKCKHPCSLYVSSKFVTTDAQF